MGMKGQESVGQPVVIESWTSPFNYGRGLVVEYRPEQDEYHVRLFEYRDITRVGAGDIRVLDPSFLFAAEIGLANKWREKLGLGKLVITEDCDDEW